MKKFLSSILCVMLIVTMIPTMAFAEDVGEPAEHVETWLVYSDLTLEELNAIKEDGGNQAEHLTDLLWMEDGIVAEKYLYTAEYKWSEEEECHSFIGNIKEVPYDAELEFKYGSGEERPIAKDITAEHIEGTSNKFSFMYHHNEDGEYPHYDFYTYFNERDYCALVRIVEPGEEPDNEPEGDEYRITWLTDGPPKVFKGQEEAEVYYEMNGSLAEDIESEECELAFRIGTWSWDEDRFIPFDNQDGLCKSAVDEETGTTCLILHPEAIAAFLPVPSKDEDVWFEIQPVVLTGEEEMNISHSRDVRLMEPEVEFDYFMDDEQFLLPGDQFEFGTEVRASVRNAEFPDWEEFWLEITDVSIEGGDGIVQLIPWEDECGWSVRTLKTGEGVLKITHDNYIEGEAPIVKEIPLDIVDDIWRTDIDYVDREKEEGKLEVTLMANARHYQYRRGENTETGEDYQVVWNLSDPDEVNAEIISEDNETITVTCDGIDSGFRVHYEIYEADADLSDGSAEPADSGERWIHMNQTFYTFEVKDAEGHALDSELELDETAAVEAKVIRHFMDGEEPAEETAEAEFFYDDFGSDVLDVETSVEDGVFLINISRNFNSSAKLWIEAYYCDDENDIWWTRKLAIDELNLGVSDETDKFYAYRLEKGEYVRMNNIPVDDEEGYPAFFAGESGTNEFYILWKAADNVQAEDLQLDIFEVEGWENRYVRDIDDGSKNGVKVELQDGLYQDAYYVWKITVGEDFDMAKAGMTLNVLQSEEDEDGYTFVMWILGEDYSWCPEDSYNNGIYIVQEIPEDKIWNSLDDVSSEWPKINLNLSETADSGRNTFYILQQTGETTNLGLGQLHVYSINNGSGVGGGGFRVEKKLDADSALVTGTPIDVTIGGKAYEAVPVNLDKFLGHSHLYITAENSSGDLRACISFGMDVYFEGTLAGIEKIGPVWNDVNRMFGYDPVFPDFEIVKDENGGIKAYFEDACAIITDIGQGSVCTVSIGLKEGYVITDIHDGENPFVFLADDSSLYNMWDADGNLIDSDEELDSVGWDGPRSGGSDQADGTHKTAPGTVHRIATYGIDGVGYENVTYLKQFLDENGFTAEKLGDFTDYNMYFDKAQYEGTNPAETIKIVFHVARPEGFKENKFQIFGRDDIELDTKELDEEEYESELYNENVQQLHGEDFEVKKVYEIAETRGQVAGNGIICIAISEEELDGGNLEDYTVVYFTEEGVPVEVETTYAEGDGLVFTTGHFSKYAVIGKKIDDGEGGSGDEDGNDPAPQPPVGGGGGFVPSKPADPLETVKKEANTEVNTYADADDYADTEAAEIQAILNQAKKDIEAAKTAEEVEAIKAAAKAEIDKIETSAEKALISEVESIKFKARSKAAKLNGKKAVKVTWNVPEGMEFDGFEIYRSTKRYKGYGKKPFYTAKLNYYINNKDLKTGKTYYYKVRGFKYVNDEKVYTKWSWKAWRTVK